MIIVRLELESFLTGKEHGVFALGSGRIVVEGQAQILTACFDGVAHPPTWADVGRLGLRSCLSCSIGFFLAFGCRHVGWIWVCALSEQHQPDLSVGSRIHVVIFEAVHLPVSFLAALTRSAQVGFGEFFSLFERQTAILHRITDLEVALSLEQVIFESVALLVSLLTSRLRTSIWAVRGKE